MDDERVLERAIAGSRDAFDELVRRHRGPIYTLISTLTRDDPDTDDLTQETFIRAYTAIVRFRQESTFRTWLSRIAINVVRTHRMDRQRRRQRTLNVDFASGAEHRIADALVVRNDVEAMLSRRQAILRALAMLPEDWRVALTLRDVQGFEYHEIATVLNVPMGTVESRVFRARRRLRPLLRQWLHRSSAVRGGDLRTREEPGSVAYQDTTVSRC